MKDSRLVTSHLSHLRHRRILPQTQLVLAVTVRRQKLSFVRVPLQRAHLRVRIHRVEHRARVGVPELDATVGGTAARREQVGLERTPRESLHGSLMRI